MEYKIFIWFFMRPLNHFFICGKLLPVLWQKPKMLQRRAFYYSYFPLRGLFLPWGTLKWISNHIMVCKWEFRFFDLLMAIFRLFGAFYYISFVNFERVCRSSQMTEKPRIWHIFSFYYYLLTAIKILWKFSQPSCDGSH